MTALKNLLTDAFFGCIGLSRVTFGSASPLKRVGEELVFRHRAKDPADVQWPWRARR